MPKAGYTIIKADSIFSPSMDFRRKKYLLIRNGIIEAVSETRPSHHRMQCLDFTGLSISPFFCDYHLHFPGNVLPFSREIAKDLLTQGIRRVWEGGDSQFSGMKMKELLKESLDIRTAGYAVYRKNTYGKFIGKGVDGFGEARGLIDYLCKEGADYFKLINSGIFNAETGMITPGGFGRDELREIVRHATERGLEVVCHANGDRQIHDAVSAGVSCIIHGLFASDETLALMAEKSVTFIPTVNAFAALSRTTTDRKKLSNIELAVDGHLFAVRKAAERGVKVLPGSDSGPHFIPYGKAYHEELVFLKKAGLSDEQILASAVVGQCRTGMPADFLIVNGIEVEKVFIRGICLKEPDSGP